MSTGTGAGLAWLNELPPADAERELLACCGSRAWARAVAAGRPYAGRADLEAAAAAAFAGLSWADVEEALAHHPRIGDRPKHTDRESTWSRAEQAGVTEADRHVAHALDEGNRAYEERFGHVFLICATGLSAEQMLAALTERLGNAEPTEREAVRTELQKIAHLRLDKLLEHP